MLGRHDADGELGCCAIVRAVERDGSQGIAAKSSLGSLAQPLAWTLNHLCVVTLRRRLEAMGRRARISYRSRTVPTLLAWTAAMPSQAFVCVLAVIITFSCSLSRLAAVQGSSLIVSLPRFIRRVERSECSTREEGRVVLSLVTKHPPARRSSGRSRFNSGCSRCWLALSL
jgi:hypothetical protein